MSEQQKHVWRIGDLCTCTYNDIGQGVIYRVTKIRTDRWDGDLKELTIAPVHSVFADITRRKPRTHDERSMKPLSLVDLGMTYLALGRFIADEAKKMGEDSEPAPDA